MKSSFFGLLSFWAALLFLITACTNESKTDSFTGNDSVDHSSTAPATANTTTITTTPQQMVVIKHKVKDFAAWKKEYEAHDSIRMANGVHNYVIGRGVDDSATVLVALKVDDIDKAKTFAKDPGLKQRMQKGGVLGTPSIEFVTMIYQDTAVISSTIRSEVTLKIKDWADWEKTFKDGEQERIDNGITVRAYGHNPDDNTKVKIVTAIIDTAKARVYWNSDMLKKRRTDGGVMGTPERFVFRVVQRY
jgi:hypothetical protein